MQTSNGRALQASHKFLAAGLCLATLFVAAPTATAGNSCWDYTRAERGLARKINRARDRHDLGRLSLDRHLSKVSRYHAYEMIKRDSVYHTSTAALSRRVTRWILLAENIGRAPKVRRVFRLMMKSDYHRANILRAGFRFFGVGVKRDNGNAWVVITFESRRDPGTTLAMPSC